MFSSLLPPPRHCSHPTIKVVLPEKDTASSVLMVPSDASSLVVANASATPKTLAELHLDTAGAVDYGKTIAAASSQSAHVQASFEDTVPLKKKYPNLKHHFPRYTLETCPDDSLATCIAETRRVVEDLLRRAEGAEPAEPASAVVSLNSTSLDGEDVSRTIEVSSYQEDPMLPAKFKLRKNREKPPSPPPPVLKQASTEKVTKELKDKWHIPSAVSNWKNNQGFAISLDKRVTAASGGSVESGSSINIQRFGELSSALEHADQTAREEIAQRNEQRQQLVLEEKERKDKQLKELLAKARSRGSAAKRPRDDYAADSKRQRY